MKNPFDQKRDPINYEIFQRFIDNVDFDKLKIEFYDSIFESVYAKIDDYVKENNPDLLVNFNILYQNLTIEMKHMQDVVNNIEKKAKKVFESSSLCEDVYSMRDELKVLKKKMDKFNNAIKKMID
jgi:hypothetical protein